MDKLKDLLMNLLDANKDMDTHLQGLCDWYEKNRSPYAPVEEIVQAAAEPPIPLPPAILYATADDDFKPPVEAPPIIIYDEAPNQDDAPAWGVVNYQ